MSTFQINQDDYVLLSDEKGKRRFVKVIELEDAEGNFQGSDAHEKDPEVFSFTADDIIALLPNGKMTPGTSAFGVKFEPYLESRHVKYWNDVDFYAKLDKENRQMFTTALKNVGFALHKDGLFPDKEVIVQIKAPSGKMAGMYKHSRNERKPDFLIIHANSFNNEDVDYVICHEAGHMIWHNLVPSSFKSRWIKLYKSAIKIHKVTDKDLDNCLEALMDTKSVKLAQIESGVKDIFHLCVEYIKKTYSMSADDLEVLADEEDVDTLKEIWPDKADLVEREILLTEYALKNVKELFAEAFSFYYTKRQIPSKIEKLMKKTLAAVKAMGEETQDDEDVNEEEIEDTSFEDAETEGKVGKKVKSNKAKVKVLTEDEDGVVLEGDYEVVNDEDEADEEKVYLPRKKKPFGKKR